MRRRPGAARPSHRLARPARHTPRAVRAAGNPPRRARAETRIARALVWLTALADILAGNPRYHRPVRPVLPPEIAAFRAPRPRPHAPRPKTEAARAAARATARATARLGYLRQTFATVPTAAIATRLARRLGLTPAHPAWPHDLAAISEPPAAWAIRTHQRATPAPHPVAQVRALVRATSDFLRLWEATSPAARAPRERPT